MRFVKSLIISAFPARVAYGMIGLCIFFKVERETNSIAIAGLAIGLNGITGAPSLNSMVSKNGMAS